MSVYRVMKNRNYTTMCNYHIRDMSISLKAIGLLTIFLSLPDDWKFSVRGTAAIVKDGKASVQSAMKELKAAGYLETKQTRDDKGKLGDMMYIIYEVPREMLTSADYEPVDYVIPDEAFGYKETDSAGDKRNNGRMRYPGKPCTEKPDPEKRDTDKPDTVMRDAEEQDTGKPSPEKRAQINTNRTSKEKRRTEETNKRERGSAARRYGRYQNVLLTQEEYDELVFDFPEDCNDMIENLSEYMYLHKRSYPDHLATMRAWARKDRMQAKAAASLPQSRYDRKSYRSYDGESL